MPGKSRKGAPPVAYHETDQRNTTPATPVNRDMWCHAATYNRTHPMSPNVTGPCLARHSHRPERTPQSHSTWPHGKWTTQCIWSTRTTTSGKSRNKATTIRQRGTSHSQMSLSLRVTSCKHPTSSLTPKQSASPEFPYPNGPFRDCSTPRSHVA